MIRKRNELTKDFVKIYCVCPDPECAHSFAMDLTFSHTLKPSGKVVEQLMLERFADMSNAQQTDFFALLGREADRRVSA